MGVRLVIAAAVMVATGTVECFRLKQAMAGNSSSALHIMWQSSMGLSFSLLSWNWFPPMRNKIFGLAGTKVIVARSISFREKEVHKILRSLNFKRSNSSNKMMSGDQQTNGAVMERSLSFKSWEPEVAKLVVEDHGGVSLQPSSLKILENFVLPHVKLPQQLAEFSFLRPLSELVVATMKVQKVYVQELQGQKKSCRL
ncbi:hypothetical protein Cni_G02435 [Canna indica]|uniref:Uncharacterized protein n=1 Tax=Canna indica TaxID=4628 RepID=A0AAQ3PZW0_9LILI|nr:hypothetical protein Cni_G02435 [Canna indica]